MSNLFFDLAKQLSEKTDTMVFDMLDKNGAEGCRSKAALAARGFQLDAESTHEVGYSETAYILRNINTKDEIARRTITVRGLEIFDCE